MMASVASEIPCCGQMVVRFSIIKTLPNYHCRVVVWMMLIYHVDWMLLGFASSLRRPADASSCTSRLLRQGAMLNNSSPV